MGPHRGVAVTSSGGWVIEIEIAGTTPHYWSLPVAAPSNHNFRSFEYFSPSGISSLSVKFRNEMGEMVFPDAMPLPFAEI